MLVVSYHVLTLIMKYILCSLTIEKEKSKQTNQINSLGIGLPQNVSVIGLHNHMGFFRFIVQNLNFS